MSDNESSSSSGKKHRKRNRKSAVAEEEDTIQTSTLTQAQTEEDTSSSSSSSSSNVMDVVPEDINEGLSSSSQGNGHSNGENGSQGSGGGGGGNEEEEDEDEELPTVTKDELVELKHKAKERQQNMSRARCTKFLEGFEKGDMPWLADALERVYLGVNVNKEKNNAVETSFFRRLPVESAEEEKKDQQKSSEAEQSSSSSSSSNKDSSSSSSSSPTTTASTTPQPAATSKDLVIKNGYVLTITPVFSCAGYAWCSIRWARMDATGDFLDDSDKMNPDRKKSAMDAYAPSDLGKARAMLCMVAPSEKMLRYSGMTLEQTGWPALVKQYGRLDKEATEVITHTPILSKPNRSKPIKNDAFPTEASITVKTRLFVNWNKTPKTKQFLEAQETEENSFVQYIKTPKEAMDLLDAEAGPIVSRIMEKNKYVWYKLIKFTDTAGNNVPYSQRKFGFEDNFCAPDMFLVYFQVGLNHNEYACGLANYMASVDLITRAPRDIRERNSQVYVSPPETPDAVDINDMTDEERMRMYQLMKKEQMKQNKDTAKHGRSILKKKKKSKSGAITGDGKAEEVTMTA